MSDNPTGTPPENGGQPEPPKPEDKPTFEPVTSQEQFDRMVQDRIAREKSKFADYEELKTKAAKLDEFDDSQKSEITKLTERATAAEKRAQDAEMNELRTRVVTAKGLKASWAERLRGSTEEEMSADADRILEDMKGTTPGASDGGPRGEPPGGSTEMDPAKLAANISRR